MAQQNPNGMSMMTQLLLKRIAPQIFKGTAKELMKQAGFDTKDFFSKILDQLNPTQAPPSETPIVPGEGEMAADLPVGEFGELGYGADLPVGEFGELGYGAGAEGAGAGGAGASAADMAAAEAWDSAFAGGAAEGAAAGGAASGAGETAASMGLGAWAAVAAPLVMAWMQYTGGNHRNDPLLLRNESLGAARYLSDLAQGKSVDVSKVGYNTPYGRFGDYSLKKGGINPITGEDEGPEKAASAGEAFQYMTDRLKYGGGDKINANLTPQQVYRYMLQQGTTPDQLNKLLGRNDFGDWGNDDFDLMSWWAKSPGTERMVQND